MATYKKTTGTMRDYMRQVMRNKATGFAGSYTEFRQGVMEAVVRDYKPTPRLISMPASYNEAYKQLSQEGVVLPRCLTKTRQAVVRQLNSMQ